MTPLLAIGAFAVADAALFAFTFIGWRRALERNRKMRRAHRAEVARLEGDLATARGYADHYRTQWLGMCDLHRNCKQARDAAGRFLKRGA